MLVDDECLRNSGNPEDFGGRFVRVKIYREGIAIFFHKTERLVQIILITTIIQKAKFLWR